MKLLLNVPLLLPAAVMKYDSGQDPKVGRENFHNRFDRSDVDYGKP